MGAILSREDTVAPTDEDASLATEAARMLSHHAGVGLSVHLDDGQALPLPQAVRDLLAHVLAEIAQGNAVTLIPIHAEMTTQEAADFLNVSRPHLVKLLDSGAIPHHKVGTHRRVRFRDLRDFKARKAARAEERLADLTREAQELGMGY